jgi:phosphonatase-like hydrolase
MPKVSLVIFDLAGTLIEDHGEVVDAFRIALRDNGIIVSQEDLIERKGASKREVIRYFIEEQFGPIAEHTAEADRTYSGFQRLLRNLYIEKGIKPIAGAVETFDVLRKRGIKLATTTGFDREVSNLILEATEWEELLPVNISSTEVLAGRPAPFMIFHAMELSGVQRVQEVVNVGDTPLDLQAGANAGVMGVVGVLSGMHPRERLLGEPHTHLINSVAVLPEVVAELSA